MLFLVRHAMPALDPEVPPENWELDAAGRRGAETLKHVIPADAMLVSSQEPKARQTLEPTGHVFTDARFNEVARNEPYRGDFRARRSPTSPAPTTQGGNHASRSPHGSTLESSTGTSARPHGRWSSPPTAG